MGGAAACLAVAAGCGDAGSDGVQAPAALGYMPRDAWLVAVVPTDLEGEQPRRFEGLLALSAGERDPRTLRAAAAELFGSRIDFEREVEPLLGAELVLAAWGDPEDPELLAALETTDGERARDVLAKLGAGGFATVDGDTALMVFSGRRELLRAAVDRRRAGEGLDELPAGALGGEETLLRAFGDPLPALRALDPALVDALPGATELPWVRALHSYEPAVRLEDDALRIHARVSTDPGAVRDEDLPLATGGESPEVGRVDGAIAAGNRDQSRTTVFLTELARRAFPQSLFVREVEALEADLGLSFEQEVLEQFDGPSASVATPDGAFAAVSELADPDRMRELLPRLAPRLPPVLRGLQGLGERGLLTLLLFAPDAPLAPGVLLSLAAQIEVQPLSGGPGEQLYRIFGLDGAGPGGEPALPGTGEVVFGMIGDRFVVATDLERARSVAGMEISRVDDTRGAAVAWADLGTWSRQDLNALGFGTIPLGEAVGELEAARDGLEGRLRIAVPDGLGG